MAENVTIKEVQQTMAAAKTDVQSGHDSMITDSHGGEIVPGQMVQRYNNDIIVPATRYTEDRDTGVKTYQDNKFGFIRTDKNFTEIDTADNSVCPSKEWVNTTIGDKSSKGSLNRINVSDGSGGWNESFGFAYDPSSSEFRIASDDDKEIQIRSGIDKDIEIIGKYDASNEYSMMKVYNNDSDADHGSIIAPQSTITGIDSTTSDKVLITREWYNEKSTSGGATLQAEYRWSTSLTGDPGSGKVAGDNADTSLSTELRVSKTTNVGADAGRVLLTIDDDDKLYIQDISDSSVYYLCIVTGASVDNTTYVTIPISIESSGVQISNNAKSSFIILAGAATPTLTKVLTAGNDANNIKITNIGNATADGDALNRISADGRYLQLSGGTMSGDIIMSSANIQMLGNDLENVNQLSFQTGGTLNTSGFSSQGDVISFSNILPTEPNYGLFLQNLAGVNQGVRLSWWDSVLDEYREIQINDNGVKCTNTLAQIVAIGNAAVATKEYVDQEASGATQNLSEVLTEGNDAGGLDINNYRRMLSDNYYHAGFEYLGVKYGQMSLGCVWDSGLGSYTASQTTYKPMLTQIAGNGAWAWLRGTAIPSNIGDVVSFETEMYLSSDGKLGLGLNTPSTILEVNGPVGSQFRISRDIAPTQYSEISGGASLMEFKSVSSAHSVFSFVSDNTVTPLESMRIDANGTATLPRVNNTNIDTAGAKALTTKEYCDANYSGGVETFSLAFGREFNSSLFSAVFFPASPGYEEDATANPRVYSTIPVNSTITKITWYANVNNTTSFTLRLAKATLVDGVPSNDTYTYTNIGTITGRTHTFTGLSISLSAGDHICLEADSVSGGSNLKGVNIVVSGTED